MSPEIKRSGVVIADVPDETGWHEAKDGSPIYVNVDLIEANNNHQLVGLAGTSVGNIGELRTVGLTQEGIGTSANTKKGGDGKGPTLDVALHDRPIRVTYSRRVRRDNHSFAQPRHGTIYEERSTHYNPRWVRGHGQR